jgi:hypothetical protein
MCLQGFAKQTKRREESQEPFCPYMYDPGPEIADHDHPQGLEPVQPGNRLPLPKRRDSRSHLGPGWSCVCRDSRNKRREEKKVRSISCTECTECFLGVRPADPLACVICDPPRLVRSLLKVRLSKGAAAKLTACKPGNACVPHTHRRHKLEIPNAFLACVRQIPWLA